ncbi:hypothetical protein HPB50_001391 [Hyalomma asiaticum]|uniref:Uncharacterized protein n=1 Tax=Hyalomma asiaticum TaxID=266040 RepID=A0ACB7RZS6_HYAAI|nr:hypothetical protein HPB50_001391 [Hyalomma asiaticum]
MFGRTEDGVEPKNVGASTSHSNSTVSSTSWSTSSSSSSESERTDGLGRLKVTTRRPGFHRLELHELLEIRQMQAEARRAADAAAHGDGADSALDSSTTCAFPLLQPAQGTQNAQERARSNVLVMPANWHMNPKCKTILQTTAVFCVFAFVLCVGATLWTRVMDRGILYSTSRTSYAKHEDLPFFSDCDQWACHEYMSAIEHSINRSQDPCRNFYRFVCDGWKHQHHLLSVVDAAEDAMYGRALKAIEWSSKGGSGQYFSAQSTLNVESRVAGFAKSCMELAQSSLPELRKFMAERHLPWPKTSR